jgi:splicing factor 3A subunit 3
MSSVRLTCPHARRLALLFPTTTHSSFYDRLKEVRDAHRHFPNVLAPDREATDAALAEEVRVEFTGEEGGGRYLDLHELYRTYTNAPFGQQTDYLAYLDSLGALSAIARPKKFHKAYAAYLRALTDYLVDFRRRSAPLTYMAPVLARARDAFAAAWEAGEVAGWEDRGVGHVELPEGTLDLDVFESPEVRASRHGVHGTAERR